MKFSYKIAIFTIIIGIFIGSIVYGIHYFLTSPNIANNTPTPTTTPTATPTPAPTLNPSPNFTPSSTISPPPSNTSPPTSTPTATPITNSLISTETSCSNCFTYFPFEIDAIVDVVWIRDGDTFNFSTKWIKANFTSLINWVRLADIDAPESNESGYEDARNYLAELLADKRVYLDIDDLYNTDNMGEGDRFVSVVYVDYNSTHYLNVNKKLLEENLAIRDPYENEFYEDIWVLYYLKSLVVP